MSDTAAPAEKDRYENTRWKTSSVRVFAAMDTMPQIAERVLALVGEGRVMNKIATYVQDDGLKDLRHLDHATGLRKGGHDFHPEGHRVWQDGDQAGFSVYLTHAGGGLGTMEGFSVGVMRYNAETEKQVRARYDKARAKDAGFFDRRQDITYLEIHGRPGEPHRNDRIEILNWNEHGVLRHTVITFVEPDWCNSGRVTETNYVIVGHRKNEDGSPHRYTHGELPEVFATYKVEGSAEATLELVMKALATVKSRDDVDMAWVAEEKVTRERRSV